MSNMSFTLLTRSAFNVQQIVDSVIYRIDKKRVDELYTEMQRIGEMCGCNQFRILAHGGYLPRHVSFELHGLTVSDES